MSSPFVFLFSRGETVAYLGAHFSNECFILRNWRESLVC